MEETIASAIIGTWGLLAYKHYDFYKKISNYIYLLLITSIVAYGAYCLILSKLSNSIKNLTDESSHDKIRDIIREYYGNTSLILFILVLLLIVNAILTIAPFVIKSHPYNKTKKNSSNDEKRIIKPSSLWVISPKK